VEVFLLRIPVNTRQTPYEVVEVGLRDKHAKCKKGLRRTPQGGALLSLECLHN